MLNTPAAGASRFREKMRNAQRLRVLLPLLRIETVAASPLSPRVCAGALHDALRTSEVVGVAHLLSRSLFPLLIFRSNYCSVVIPWVVGVYRGSLVRDYFFALNIEYFPCLWPFLQSRLDQGAIRTGLGLDQDWIRMGSGPAQEFTPPGGFCTNDCLPFVWPEYFCRITGFSSGCQFGGKLVLPGLCSNSRAILLSIVY